MATFNARAETVETKPFFRDAFKRSRCVIPLSGYYQWRTTRAVALVRCLSPPSADFLISCTFLVLREP